MTPALASWSWRAQVLCFAALALVAMVPLAAVSVPPLVDYPNHLARMYVLFQASALEPLRQFYAADWKLLPNLAMEGVAPLLMLWLPVESAGKVFVGLTLLLLASGTAALHYALFRRVSPWPLAIFLVLYNRIFLWGFLNYLFALGLALWVFAAWVHWHGRGVAFRSAVFTLLSVLLFLAHLYAFGIYALCVGTFELGRLDGRRALQWRRLLRAWLPAAVSLLTPVVLFVLFSPTSEGAGMFQYGRLMRKVAALVSLFNNYHRPLDTVSILIVGAIGLLALAQRRLLLHRAMRLPLAALAIAFVAMPSTLFTSHGSDVRFAIAFAAFFVAGTEMAPLTRQWRNAFAAVLAGLFVVRTGVLLDYWRDSDREYAEFRRAFATLPAGSRLFTAEGQTVEWLPFPTPTAHLPCLAVIERGVFVPSLFHYPTQQPLRLRDEYAVMARRAPEVIYKDRQPVPWRYVLGHYTHVLVVDQKGAVVLPPSGLKLVWRSDHFRLFRVG